MAQRTDDTLPGDAATGQPEMFQQLGAITRQLHDALQQLGHADKIRGTVDRLPDAQSRLNYIARLTGEAADKVLGQVELAKAEQALIAQRGCQLGDALALLPGSDAAELRRWAAELVQASEQSDARLTEIMLAQDFHDLTGQVIGRVVQLAATIEEQLLALLLRSAPSGQPGQDHAITASGLDGPVVSPAGRSDVVNNQKQVDDLLASLGF